MNEHELSNLLHEAAGDATVSSTASRRVLRRTRLRMATTGGIALSLIALLVGGGIAFATRETVSPQPNLKPAGPTATPAPQQRLLSFLGPDEVIVGELEGEDSLWAFTLRNREDELCLSSTTYTEERGEQRGESVYNFGTQPGIGGCLPLEVQEGSHVGFYMSDSPNKERLEVLGVVSSEVARLELQGSIASDSVVRTSQATDSLGNKRTLFFLWLPLEEVGTLVAYDSAGNLLEEKELCLEPGAPRTSCVVGEAAFDTEPSKEGDNPTGTERLDEERLACNKDDRASDHGEGEQGISPREALQEWLDKVSLHSIRVVDFDAERIGSGVRGLFLPHEDGDFAMWALATRVPAPTSSEFDQWKLGEIVYCPDLLDP
jgi:hypothetical protein